jgi:hypothetical protein
MIHSRTSTTLLWLALPFMAVALFSQLFRQTAPIMAQGNGPATAANLADQMIYLPLISVPENPDHTYSNVIVNGSFEEGWTDFPPAPGFLINQQPIGWTAIWIEPGQSLYDDSTLANGVPEMVHKPNSDLPLEQRYGGSDALVLDGEHVYKIFHFGASFGAELQQTVTDLIPGSVAALTVPIRVHLHGDGDPYGAESRVTVNGIGQWVTGSAMGDEAWYSHTVVFTVPADGVAVVRIQVKSKWNSSKDFFIDNVRLMAVTP